MLLKRGLANTLEEFVMSAEYIMAEGNENVILCERGNDHTLVLIDEFGGGTEPQIGGALAQAVLRKLNDLGVYGVITTHYQNLKNFANSTPGIVNGAMLYDRQKMQPLFQLSIGTPGSSFAIEIAKKIGIPAEKIRSNSELSYTSVTVPCLRTVLSRSTT